MPKDYRLFAVLGDPVFKRYARTDAGEPLQRLKSDKDLPHNVCEEIEQRAAELGRDDETSPRWMWFESLDVPEWEQPHQVSYVHGPRDHAAFRSHGHISTGTIYDSAKREWLESVGFRLVSTTQMDALIASDPSLVNDPQQSIAKVFCLAESSKTLAETLGFSSTLAWLRAEAEKGPLRVVFFIEV